MEEDQDPVCLGCHRSIEEGSVVAFGEGLWHVQCFRCAKCKNRVECDSNLLLLSDGSPICEQCSYSCNACRRPILDEAIMTGEEAYHADCFRCIQCESKIDDLVFAKTSQGIYCMKCHQERKEAKRQREERERMERAERMMEKLLPTIPEGEKRPNHSVDKPLPPFGLSPYDSKNTYVPQTQYQQQNQNSQHSISRPDFNGSQHQQPKFSPVPRTDSRAKPNGPSVDMGPPFLPPLKFDFEDTASSGFDLGDMLGSDTTTTSKESGSKDKEKEKTIIIETPSSPISPRDSDLAKAQEKSTYRVSIGRASPRLSASSADTSEQSSLNNDGTRPSSESPEPNGGLRSLSAKGSQSQLTVDSIPHSRSSQDQSEHDTMSSAEAAAMIRELRMELAKYNPTSHLLHGTPQQEYGMLLRKTEELTAKHNQLEKSLRDLYIEKDLLGMDLEVMNTELKEKEEALASNTPVDRLQPPTPNPRMSTSHDFMKQAYQVEVKALQEQKEKLQKEIQTFVDQRDGVLNEMQILSVRNAELSTINNDMMREMQGRIETKPSGPPPSMSSSSNNGGMLQSFTDKIRRQRQHSGGNQQELRANHIAGSNDSTYSFTSTGSDDRSGRQGSGETVYKARKEERIEERQEDIFGEEIVQPKKFNWKKGTTNAVKNAGAMFGKLLVEGPSGNLEVPVGRGPSSSSDRQMLSDNGSSNGQILPPRSFSSSSETRSLNGSRYTEQHYFIQHNYIRPTRCEYCDDKMWGREYKCRNCGFQIHGRCTHEIIPGCSGKFKDCDSNSLRNVTPSGGSAHGSPPSPPAKQIMFGNNLLDQLELEQRSVPLVVEKCIEAVDARGLEVEGIYRRSGMAAEARQLVQAYDCGMHPDLMDDGQYQDICSITSVLKQYLRTLPEPLIPYDMYDDFMEAISLPQNDGKMQTFKDLMERMPFAYYQTLKVLLEHLNRVRQQDHINLMNAKNLSVVFGPTLMRNPDSSREILDMTFKNMTIEFFIINTTELFVRNERPSTSSNASGVSGGMLPHPGLGQRQGSIGSIPGLNNVGGHMSPPPRRAQLGPSSSPMLPARSLSGDNIPTSTAFNQQAGQQSQPGQFQPYRPQAFPQPQHQTLQQLKQQVQLQQQQQQQQHLQQQATEQEAPAAQSQSQPQQPTPPPSQNPSAVSSPFAQLLPQHQQANPNPEVDMTNFP